VAISHVVVLTGALLTLLSLPCVLMAVAGTQVGVRRGEARPGRETRRDLRRLDRAIHQPPCIERIAAAQETLPPIEQIAAELRRLNRQRDGGPTQESEVWLAAVLRAYDTWLWAACSRLGVAERLTALEGPDRDAERVRVEGELETAGLVFRRAAGRPPR
jgi:hypothetical protein